MDSAASPCEMLRKQCLANPTGIMFCRMPRVEPSCLSSATQVNPRLFRPEIRTYRIKAKLPQTICLVVSSACLLDVSRAASDDAELAPSQSDQDSLT